MAVSRVVSQSVPRRNGQIKVVLVAALAGIVNGYDDGVALPTDAIITIRAGVGEPDLTSAVRALVLVVHPVVADCHLVLAVKERVTTGAIGAGRVRIDRSLATVPAQPPLLARHGREGVAGMTYVTRFSMATALTASAEASKPTKENSKRILKVKCRIGVTDTLKSIFLCGLFLDDGWTHGHYICIRILADPSS